MTTKVVLRYPDPRLREPAEVVERFDAGLEQLGQDLVDTLEAHPGAWGLCATQIGTPLQVVALRMGKTQTPLLFVNPEVVRRHGLGRVEERCLSVPEVGVSTWRALRLKIRYQTVEGHRTERTLEHIEAVALQHELEHFDGKLLIDRLGWWSRWQLRRKAPGAALQL